MRTKHHIGNATKRVGLRRPSLLYALLWCVCSQLAAGAAIVSAAERSREEKRSITVRGESHIYLKNARGKTIILGRKDGAEVLVRAKKFVKTKSAEQVDECAGGAGERVAGSVGQRGGEEGLLAGGVAAEHELGVSSVPDGEGVHALELVGELVGPEPVPVEDDLGVGVV